MGPRAGVSSSRLGSKHFYPLRYPTGLITFDFVVCKKLLGVSRAEPGCGVVGRLAQVLGLGSWRPSATAMNEGDQQWGDLGYLWVVGVSKGLVGQRAGSRPAV